MRLIPRQILWAALAAVLLAGCAAPAVPDPAPAPALALEPCRLSAPGAPETVSARCATLAVPEDHGSPDGRRIGLRVAVVPAVSDSGAAPLFLLAGGPGQASSEAFTPLLPALREVSQSRDLVLVDQRGTGQSAPLRCPVEEESPELTASADEAALRAWLRGCLASLEADPTRYTTPDAARDLEAVRAALGYEQVSLLGVSYGTRLALTYLRLFPERVAALVLDGVVPPDLAIGAAMARDGQAALDKLFAACAADRACAAAFPDPAGDLAALLERLGREPATVTLDDPFSGTPTELTLTRDLVAITIHGLSYAPETAALLPLLLRSAQAGDLRPLAAQILIVSRQLADSVAVGLRSSVLCAEDQPFYPPAADPQAGYLGDSVTRSFTAICAEWPAAPADPALRTPVAADVPALLLSGERDPVTPPAYGEAVAQTLPNSRHLVAPGQGHNVFFRGCLPGLVARFLEAGSAAGLDVACVERLGDTPFFTSFTGPQP